MKKLLVISHTPHYRRGRSFVGWAATVREISYLSRKFDTVCHLAPVHAGPVPANCVEYDSSNVEVRPVLAAGGETLGDKLSILACYPAYAKAIREEVTKADVIHVRCPANISLLALVQLKVRSGDKQIWVKYAGDWNGYAGEPASYRLQRQLLRRWPGQAVVTVNGTWPDQPDHIRPFHNPCLTEGELDEAASLVKPNINLQPATLTFAGRLDSHKGFPVFLQIVRKLHADGHQIRAEVVGDGPDRGRFEQQARLDGLAGIISFAGWRTREQMNEYYQRANFIVLPSRAEGWPKVLSEAMAFGAIPLASGVGSIAQNLHEFQVGKSFTAQNPDAYCEAIAEYVAHPERWSVESAKARIAARCFTYDAYLMKVDELLGYGRLASARYAV